MERVKRLGQVHYEYHYIAKRGATGRQQRAEKVAEATGVAEVQVGVVACVVGVLEIGEEGTPLRLGVACSWFPGWGLLVQHLERPLLAGSGLRGARKEE
jgi:hypothetical protein